MPCASARIRTNFSCISICEVADSLEICANRRPEVLPGAFCFFAGNASTRGRTEQCLLHLKQQQNPRSLFVLGIRSSPGIRNRS
jgi:hypothetical protein